MLVVVFFLQLYDLFETPYFLFQASSMGSLLLTAGEQGMRTALPNARIMVHQPSGGAQVEHFE